MADKAPPLTRADGSALRVLVVDDDRVAAGWVVAPSAEQDRLTDASLELRTPLATIQGYAELGRRTGGDDPGVLGHALGKVETEPVRMAALVGDRLLLARLDAGRPLERAPVDLTRLVLEAVADARVVAPSHRWALDLPDAPAEVAGDEHRLHQVVTNLLTNAHRHTPEGTHVTVGVDRPEAGSVRVSVFDDGPGVPAGLVDGVFDRFARGDSSRTRSSGGAGLGLALVQAIVAAHGGRATVRSEPGSTAFAVTVPVTA